MSAPYAGGGTFDGATGFATRVNQPHPAVPPLGGCTCDQIDLTHAPSCPATAPFYGELYLYGGVSYPGAVYYRIMAQHASGSGIPTPGSFGAASPILDSWSVPQPFPALPVVIQPVNPGGWYEISALATESGPYTDMLMDWSDAKADGVYLLTLELADGSLNPIPLSPAPTLLLVIDGSAPLAASPLTVNWQMTSGVGGPIDPFGWTAAYPPTSGCALIDTAGSAIALQFTASVSSPHLRQAWVSAEGCGGVTPIPAATNPPDSAVVHREYRPLGHVVQLQRGLLLAGRGACRVLQLRAVRRHPGVQFGGRLHVRPGTHRVVRRRAGNAVHRRGDHRGHRLIPANPASTHLRRKRSFHA